MDCQALYDYNAIEADELSIMRGNVLVQGSVLREVFLSLHADGIECAKQAKLWLSMARQKRAGMNANCRDAWAWCRRITCASYKTTPSRTKVFRDAYGNVSDPAVPGLG